MTKRRIALCLTVLTCVLLSGWAGTIRVQSPSRLTTEQVAHPFWKLGHPNVSPSPVGLSPRTICGVYKLPCNGGAGATIALVDAFDDPSIRADLRTFERQYSIDGCSLAVVNDHGGTTLPAPSAYWAMEISLDVEWACALAPEAHLLLVEAHSDNLRDLLRANEYASANAGYVSDSWGTPEYASESHDDRYFDRSGVSFFASAGDRGLGAQYPSASPYVVSVGGTSLTLTPGALNAETGWSSGGGGCSHYEAPNDMQVGQTGSVGCFDKRATPDVSFDADPASGVSIFNSFVDSGPGGWFQIGGTSIGSPAWAAISADAGGVMNAARVYGLPAKRFHDITVGDNGASCLPGYDLVTGRGSPIGQMD